VTTPEEVAIVDVPAEDRGPLEKILEESFEGWYLRHSKGTLHDVDVVRAAVSSGVSVGLVMLKALEPEVGYVYYIAVAKANRRTGIARLLLRDALTRFRGSGVKEVFAGVEEDNGPSEGLFMAEGFTRTGFGELSRKHGMLHALNMYRMMVVVPGEVLLHKELS
jgi:ribosomal protein S18 acetylase RimI-like enzyme